MHTAFNRSALFETFIRDVVCAKDRGGTTILSKDVHSIGQAMVELNAKPEGLQFSPIPVTRSGHGSNR